MPGSKQYLEKAVDDADVLASEAHVQRRRQLQRAEVPPALRHEVVQRVDVEPPRLGRPEGHHGHRGHSRQLQALYLLQALREGVRRLWDTDVKLKYMPAATSSIL